MKEIAFSMLRPAWFRPRIWERSFSETASPEASSPPRLIRWPEDSFSMSLLRSHSLNFTSRFAYIALMLWLMIM